MSKYIINQLTLFTFVLALALTPVSSLEANTYKLENAELQTLAVELSAMVDHLERLVGPQLGVSLTPEEMRSVIEGSVSWIINSQEEDGSFAYEYLPYDGEYSNDDNIVRQAGTLYSLAEVARKDPVERPELNETIEGSINYLASQSKEGAFEGEDFGCVVKKPGSRACSLGATSLTLVAILGYVEANPDKAEDYEELIGSYLSFLLVTKNPEAGFKYDYILDRGFRSDKESPFYNGETLLALVRYMQYQEDAEVKSVIDSVFSYLREQEYETPLYLWIMAALKDMQQLWPSDDYVTYGKDFTNYRMESLEWRHQTDRNYCAVVEGLASSYSLLEGEVSDAELQRIKSELDYWNIKNSFLQIDEDQPLRLVEDEKDLKFISIKNMHLAEGGFLTAESELKQRIDFTQHCLNTYLQTLVDIEKKPLL